MSDFEGEQPRVRVACFLPPRGARPHLLTAKQYTLHKSFTLRARPIAHVLLPKYLPHALSNALLLPLANISSLISLLLHRISHVHQLAKVGEVELPIVRAGSRQDDFACKMRRVGKDGAQGPEIKTRLSDVTRTRCEGRVSNIGPQASA